MKQGGRPCSSKHRSSFIYDALEEDNCAEDCSGLVIITGMQINLSPWGYRPIREGGPANAKWGFISHSTTSSSCG